MVQMAETTQAFTSCKCKICRTACVKAPGMWSPLQFLNFLKVTKIGYEQAFTDNLAVLNAVFKNVASDQFVAYPAIIPATKTPSNVRPFFQTERLDACVFYTSDGLCMLHKSGYKPVECATYHHDNQFFYQLASEISGTWVDFWDENIKTPKVPNIDLNQYKDAVDRLFFNAVAEANRFTDFAGSQNLYWRSYYDE